MENSEKQRNSKIKTEDFIFSFLHPPPTKEISSANKLFQHRNFLPCKPIPSKLPPLRQRRAESVNTGGLEYSRLRMATPDRSKKAACVLGVVRLPAEMEMKDIKTRQRRLGLPAPAGDNGRRRGVRYWGIVQSLSCKATECIAVAPASPAR